MVLKSAVSSGVGSVLRLIVFASIGASLIWVSVSYNHFASEFLDPGGGFFCEVPLQGYTSWLQFVNDMNLTYMSLQSLGSRALTRLPFREL